MNRAIYLPPIIQPIARMSFWLSMGVHIAFIGSAFLWTPHLSVPTHTDYIIPIEFIEIKKMTQINEDSSQTVSEEVSVNEPEPVNVPPMVQDIVKPPAADETPDIAETEAPPVLADIPASDAPPPPFAAPEKQAEPTPPIAEEDAPSEAQLDVTPPIAQAQDEATPKNEFDIAKLRALLNKIPDAPEADYVPEKTQKNEAKVTLNEIDAFRAQMQQCWQVPAGARAGEDLLVRVKLSLTADGVISKDPVVVNAGIRRNDPFFRAAAESVLRAIRRCQPFHLPPEKYMAWRNLELNFDPRKMLTR